MSRKTIRSLLECFALHEHFVFMIINPQEDRDFVCAFLGIFAIIIKRIGQKIDNYSLAFCLRCYIFEHIIKSGLQPKKFCSADSIFSKQQFCCCSPYCQIVKKNNNDSVAQRKNMCHVISFEKKSTGSFNTLLPPSPDKLSKCI